MTEEKNMNNETTVNSDYGVDQVDSLEGLEAVRRRPGMYIGSTSQKGVTHLIWEVLDNSVDEFVAGHGTNVSLHVMKDKKVKVEDHGRGMPVGLHHKWKNPDGTPMNALTGLLTKLHAGGKFNASDSGYKVSGGLHGVGAKAVNALSETFYVLVKREGKVWGQKFSKGNPVSDVLELGTCDVKDTGTIIEYLPDKEIFKQTIEPSDAAIQSRLDEITSLNAGLRILYKNDCSKVEKEFYQEDGIKGYTKRMAEGKTLLFDEVFYMKENYTLADNKVIIVELAFIYDDDDKPHETFKSFANNINTHEGGYHLQGFRNGFKDALNEFISKNNLSKDPVEMRYLMDGIYAMVSIKIPEAEFEGQTKSKLGNEEAEEAVRTVMANGFKGFFKTRTDDLKNIAERAIRVKIAEEAARKARQSARAVNKMAKTALPGKLTDCANKSGYTEIIFCEGDSAGGAVKQGRFAKFQAVLPLRGKVLNVEKATLDKMMNSDAIKNIVSSIGTGMGPKFDIKKLRYEKIIIMTDADIDGSHIRTLILTLLYNYMRPLLEEGYVYASKPPLFRVTLKNKKYEYIQTDEDLKEFKKKNGNKIESVQRFKGLGEMNYLQLKETVLNPANRTLERIPLRDAEKAAETFNLLMGKDVAPRRAFIEENANLVDLTLL
jgi:DNA gyrase subunit B